MGFLASRQFLIDYEEIQTGEKIGSGSFAKVWEGTHLHTHSATCTHHISEHAPIHTHGTYAKTYNVHLNAHSPHTLSHIYMLTYPLAYKNTHVHPLTYMHTHAGWWNGYRVAVKKLMNPSVTEKFFIREVSNLQKSHHPNVRKCFLFIICRIRLVCIRIHHTRRHVLGNVGM